MGLIEECRHEKTGSKSYLACLYEVMPDAQLGDPKDNYCVKHGCCIEFFPNGKVRELANYSAFLRNPGRKSYRVFNEFGEVVEEKISDDTWFPIPSLKDLSPKMKKALKEYGVWDNVMAVLKEPGQPTDARLIAKHAETLSPKRNVRTY